MYIFMMVDSSKSSINSFLLKTKQKEDTRGRFDPSGSANHQETPGVFRN